MKFTLLSFRKWCSCFLIARLQKCVWTISVNLLPYEILGIVRSVGSKSQSSATFSYPISSKYGSCKHCCSKFLCHKKILPSQEETIWEQQHTWDDNLGKTRYLLLLMTSFIVIIGISAILKLATARLTFSLKMRSVSISRGTLNFFWMFSVCGEFSWTNLKPKIQH